MSRSKRRTPITGRVQLRLDSEKADKRAGHGRTRAASRVMLARGDDSPLPIKRTENPWDYAKDGKRWLGDRHPELMRK